MKTIDKRFFKKIFLGFLLLSFCQFHLDAQNTNNDSKSSPLRIIEALKQLRELQNNSPFTQSTKGIPQIPLIKINNIDKTTSTIYFYDNIESGLNGWTTEIHSGTIDNLWHQTTQAASSPTHSWWCGTESQLNYYTGNRISNSLISPAIDLTPAIPPLTLLFAENYYTESGWDFCMVDISSDGGFNWTALRGSYGSAPCGDSKGWLLSTIDLTPYAGQQVKIRFHFDTGDSLFNEFPGWFIDDVLIFDQGGKITGKTFFDVNNNGIKDIGERGIKDWWVKAEGPVTILAQTNVRGRYWHILPLGDYNVTEILKPSWTQTYPDTGYWNVNLSTPDTLVDSIHFGNYRQASFILGSKFNDLNRNGIYDGTDTQIYNWKILFTDTLFNEIDYDKTDSLGTHMLYVFEPGIYIVSEKEYPGWVQTYPEAGNYRIEISDLNTTLQNLDFGNYYTDSVNSIIGQKFLDINKNGLKDIHEPGLSNWIIRLTGKKNKQTLTDSLGYYKFLNLPEGIYQVKEVTQNGWCQSYPGYGTWNIALTQGSFMDDVDFGNYPAPPGSISGVVFNDINGNGIKDIDELGLSGFRINLSGDANASVTSGFDGSYSIPNLWPGTYFVSEVFRQGWVQTYPQSFGVHTINLVCEENRADVNFGNIDSTFLYTFRTFPPESLALAVDKKGRHKPLPQIPDKVEFIYSFVNEETTSVAGIKIRFIIPVIVGSITSIPNGSVRIVDDKYKIVEIIFDSPLEPDSTLIVRGYGKKPVLQEVRKWFWLFGGGQQSLPYSNSNLILNELRLPMPNAINVLQKVGQGLRIGLGGPHSIGHTTYKYVIKSLIDRNNRMHIGEPRSLYKLSNGREIKRERRYLTPTQGQNRLFAQSIALKVNIIASELSVTPPGFGGLIFDDDTEANNPLNNLSLYEIAAKLDSFMSLTNLPPIDSLLLDSTIQKINNAFTGPIDTSSFAVELKMTGVSPLSDIPFLRYDTSSTPIFYQLIVKEIIPIAEQFELMQNYPNPFNPTTTIEFYLPEESYITLKIYNTLGQEVAVIFNKEEFDDGLHDIEISAEKYKLASGVYYYKLIAESIGEDSAVENKYVSMRKMILIK